MGVNLLLCIVSVSVFLGGSETLARLWYSPQKVNSDSFFEYDKEKVFRLKANFHGPNWGSTFTTNSHGFRGREIAIEKPENTKRILIAGDSVAFGQGVNDDEVFPYYLEQQLNEQFAGSGENVRIEVINTAAPGNSPYQEYHDVKRGLKFDPDIIVLQVTLNDIIHEQSQWTFLAMGMEESESETTSINYVTGKKRLPQFDYLLRQHSALYLFLKDINARLRFKDLTGKHIAKKAASEENSDFMPLLTEPESPTVREAWDYALSWIQIMVAIAKEHDIPFVLFATPFGIQSGYYEEYAFPQHKFKQFAEEENIYFADFLAAMWQRLVDEQGGRNTINEIIDEWVKNGSTLLQDLHAELFLDHVHFTPAGHKMAADILMPIVLEALNLKSMNE